MSTAQPTVAPKTLGKVRPHQTQNEALVFEKSSPGKRAYKMPPLDVPAVDPAALLGDAHRKVPGLLPELSDDNRFFWTSGEEGVLRILRCDDCGFYIHPPGPVCPRCLSRDVAPQEVSGRGHVETFTVNYQQWIPGSDPYIIGWVSIDEQPDVRLTTNLVDVEPDDVHVGMPVRVLFEHVEDVWLPLFTPAEEAS